MPPDAPDLTPLPTPQQQAVAVAAAAGPQPAAPAPAPNPAVTPAPAATGPAAPAAPPAQAAVDQHHGILGKVASALLGKQVDYQVNPQTGQTEAVETKEKPGDLFRHIVAGAILGGAAAKGTNSVLAGFSRGGAAGMEANKAMDQQKYARAQQQFQNQREAQKGQRENAAETRANQQQEMEKQKNTAQLEMWNKEQILHERDSNLRDAEFNQRTNENSVQMQKWAHEVGGMDAPIPGNNQVGNGAAMQRLYSQDPGKFAAPKGYDRFITQDHDTTGLTFDKDKGFVDEKGNPVNLEDRTTWHVSFIPQKPQPVEISGERLNKLFPNTTGGTADPKQTYRMPFDQLAGLATTEHEVRRRDADENYKRTHDDLRADLDELKSQAGNLTRQADEAERQQDFATAKELRKQASETYDKYDETKKQSNPHSPLRKSSSGRPGEVDMPALQAKVPNWNAIPEDKAVLADKSGAIQGMATRNSPEYNNFIKNGSVEVTRPGAKASSTPSIPAGKAAAYDRNGFRGYVDKARLDEFKKIDKESGHNDIRYVEGPDAPAVPTPSSAAATGASLQ